MARIERTKDSFVLFNLSHDEKKPHFFKVIFLLNSTAVLLFTPAGGIDVADLSE